MKSTVLPLAVLLLLAACGPKGAPAPVASSAPPASTAPAASLADSSLPASTDQPAASAPSGNADLNAAQAVVRALYGPELTPFPTNPAADPYFTPELARALKADSHPGEVGAIDFDYRYGAQDVQITDLMFGAVQASAGGAREAVHFSNMGKAYEVDYDLARTGAGWRIAEVSAPAQQGDMAWSLRIDLKLKPLR